MKISKVFGLSLCVLTMFGCRANQESLSDFVKSAEQRARREVADLQPVSKFEPITYAMHDARGPFSLPQAAVEQVKPVAKKDCWQPAPRRKSGKLERFSLSQLRLKGVMGSGGSVSALVQTPKGTVVNVKPGQYMGVNNGRVVKVTNKYLLINETLPDGLGCWNKRNVKLALK